MKFKNRDEAGTLLAEKLIGLAYLNPIILALPRGGVPVARIIAEKLHAPLDVCLVKKIEAPGSEEFAIGAVTEDELPHLNEAYIKEHKLNREKIADIITKRITEIRKKVRLYREKFPALNLKGRAVIIVDDGLATGSTMLAAVKWLRHQDVKKIIVAVPIASSLGAIELKTHCDEFVSLITSDNMWAVGLWYENFNQISDAEVMHILEKKKSSYVKVTEKAVVRSLPEEIAHIGRPFKKMADLKSQIAEMAKHRIVMLGEASHGTKEYYQMRREISQTLINEYGFSFIAVEGDWPGCRKMNQLVAGGTQNSKEAARKSFHRWPTWMWANEEIPPLIEWMVREKKGAFYGLDVYSLFESIEVIRESIQKIDPALSRQMNAAYACFDEYSGNEIKYAESLLKIPAGCEKQVVSSLREALRLRLDQTKFTREELFDFQQNARIINNAEHYYRTMIQGGADSWNVRDQHMLETLENLLNFYGPDSKAIIWAHNTHVGDYHATDMLDDGYINLGGLAREKFGTENVYLLGFGSHHGEVTAGHAWGGEVETMPLPEAREGSLEDYFHQACKAFQSDKYFLQLSEAEKAGPFYKKFGHRAVGVVYNPRMEKHGSNYVPTKLAQRYDGFIFIDVTNALQPIPSTFIVGEIPETYPTGQ